MKIHPPTAYSRLWRSAGVSLIECLVYLALVFVVVGIGFMALYHATDNQRGLRRNADDIAAAVNVGELWRKDIRTATGRITNTTNEHGQTLHIPQKNARVAYQFDGRELRRQHQEGGPWTVVLPHVQASSMTADPRELVIAWRWELMLKPGSRHVRIKPVFSFEAVPGFDRKTEAEHARQEEAAAGQAFQPASPPDLPSRCSPERAIGKSSAPADKNVRPILELSSSTPVYEFNAP